MQHQNMFLMRSAEILLYVFVNFAILKEIVEFALYSYTTITICFVQWNIFIWSDLRVNEEILTYLLCAFTHPETDLTPYSRRKSAQIADNKDKSQLFFFFSDDKNSVVTGSVSLSSILNRPNTTFGWNQSVS